MVNSVEVLGGVLVFRRVAAADVTAFQAKPQMDPGIAHLDALRTDVSLGLGNFDGLKMTTLLRHVRLHVPGQRDPNGRVSLPRHK